MPYGSLCGSPCGIKNNMLIWMLAMSAFSMHHLIALTILTQYQKVRDQIDTFERPGTKLTHSLKVRTKYVINPYIN